MNPPKQKRRLCGATLKTTGLARIYHFPLFLQRETGLRQRNGQVKHCGLFHQEKRRCVSCGRRITNRNLGGNDRRSALSGPLWCLRCADYASQLLLRFEGAA